MRVLILDCGRGINPAKVATWHDKLGLRPEDDVALLSWHKPAERLPLVAHLVAGPSLTLGREPVPHPTAPPAAARFAETETETKTETEAEIEAVAAEPDLGGEEMSEQLTDPARLAPTDAAPPASGGAGSTGSTGAADETAVDAPASDVSALPRTHPRRLAHGLGWRLRRGRLVARRVTRSSAGLTELPSHVVRTAFRRRGSGIPNEFAVSVLASRRAARLFGGADVVVPVDALSTRAAWLLARREPRPDVIVTFQAAERVIAQRRAEGASDAE